MVASPRHGAALEALAALVHTHTVTAVAAESPAAGDIWAWAHGTVACALAAREAANVEE